MVANTVWFFLLFAMGGLSKFFRVDNGIVATNVVMCTRCEIMIICVDETIALFLDIILNAFLDGTGTAIPRIRP